VLPNYIPFICAIFTRLLLGYFPIENGEYISIWII